MLTYLATQAYKSGLYPGGFAAGDILDLEEAHAGSINRDAPGTLEAVVEKPKAAERTVDAPPADRQVHTAKKRGTA